MNKKRQVTRVNVAVQGWRDIGGQRNFYRSKMEMNFARFLQFMKDNGSIKHWEYECDTFYFPVNRGINNYKPDFLAIEMDGRKVYYEVKGYMDRASITKLKRMEKYHPEIELIVIDKSWFPSHDLVE